MTKYSVSAVIVLYLLVCTSLEKVKAQQGRRSCSDTTCPANDRCCSDQVLGSICYNPETHSCCENRLLCGLGLGCCQSTCYNTTLFSCTTQGIVANRPPALTITCPQLACPPGNQCCQDSELGAVCYSPTSHWCCASRLLCGRGLQCCSNTCYDPELYSCCSGALCSRQQQQQQPAPSTPPPGPVQTAQPTVSVAPPPPPATPAPTQLPTETVRPAGTSTPQPTLPATPAPQPPITPTPAPEVPAQPTPQPQPPAPATPTPVVPIPINTVPPAPVTAGSLEEQVANENCIAFSPYVDNYNPVYGPYPPRSLIDTLLDRMVGINVTCITLYGLGNGLDYAVTAAKARNIKVIVLIWLDLSEQDNEQEIQRAVYVIGNNTETVIAASCGSEVRVRLGPTRALPYIENCISKVRAAGITKPLTTIDSWWGWCQEQYPCRQWSVAQRLDWVGVNIFPWWENQASIVFPCTSADLAPRFVLDRYRDIKRNYPDKQVVITEYGWPAGPSQYSIANLCTNQRCGIASEENQLNVIARSKFVFNRERIPAVLFEAFRQPWTGSGQGAQGPYWGLCSATAPYSCPTLPTVTADQIPGPTPPLAVSPNPPRAICHDRISGLTCYDTAVQTCVNSERLCLRNQATCGPNLICYTPQQQQCCGDRLC